MSEPLTDEALASLQAHAAAVVRRGQTHTYVPSAEILALAEEVRRLREEATDDTLTMEGFPGRPVIAQGPEPREGPGHTDTEEPPSITHEMMNSAPHRPDRAAVLKALEALSATNRALVLATVASAGQPEERDAERPLSALTEACRLAVEAVADAIAGPRR